MAVPQRYEHGHDISKLNILQGGDRKMNKKVIMASALALVLVVSPLAAKNPQIKNINRIVPGQVIEIE